MLKETVQYIRLNFSAQNVVEQVEMKMEEARATKKSVKISNRKKMAEKEEQWQVVNMSFGLVGDTEYIFYCKRAILFLSSSKILTPHPPLPLASVYPPPLLRGEDRLVRGRRGWGVNILEDERNRIALLQ